MKRFKMALVLTLVLAVLAYAVGIALAYITKGQGFSIELFGDNLALILLAVGALSGLAIGLSVGDKKKKNNNEGTTTTGEKFEIAHDSKFITADELRSNPELIYTTWDKLPSVKKTGFVFRTVVHGGHHEINMKHECHALVIGTTGTGKTQVFANPTVRILAHSGEKPSLIMTDPKGELYADNSEVLKKEGYNVVVLNLDDPYASSKWNPMEIAYKTYERASNLEKEVKKYSNCKPEDVGYVRFPDSQLNGATYGDTWYGFEGKAFPNNDILKRELNARRDQLDSEAKAVLREIAIALVPVMPDAKEPMWAQGCQDLVAGIMQGMLEDSRDPRLGMTVDKFNFYNLYKMAMFRDNGDSQLQTLTRYSEGRDPQHSSVRALMMTVCGTSPTTQKSFLGTLGSSLGKTLGDDAILYMTSQTDIDFTQIAEKPTAFFIRIPDHKTERHPLGVLCITRLYQVLVDIAQRSPNRSLKRKVYFILDEFGNMPPVNEFDKMVTVGRSRNIFFEIVLQSYKQLDINYGADKAQTIRGNFQMEVFLGSEDPSTVQAFSEACGETTVFHEEENKTKSDKEEHGGSTSTSIQRSRRPLIDKAELRTRPKFQIVVKLFRQNILREKMTPFFETKNFEKKPAQMPIALSGTLDYSKVYYDIEARNRTVLGQTRRSPFGY